MPLRRERAWDSATCKNRNKGQLLGLYIVQILNFGLAKIFLQVFHKIVWKNPNEIFSQQYFMKEIKALVKNGGT